jgi:hypothetical protein
MGQLVRIPVSDRGGVRRLVTTQRQSELCCYSERGGACYYSAMGRECGLLSESDGDRG